MKNCKSLIVGCILAVLVLPLVAADNASAQNILVNGDFETGDLTGWEAFGLSGASTVTVESPDNGTSQPGTNNAFMENRGHAIGLGIKQVTPVGSATGGTVYWAFDAKLIEANVGGVLFAQLFAEQEGVGIVGGSGLIGPLWPWNEWTLFEGTFEAPANADFFVIQIVPTTGAADGTSCVVNIDNVYLSQAGPTVADEDTSFGAVKALYR